MRSFLLLVFSAIAAAAGASAFIHCLVFCVRFFQDHWWYLIFAAPFVGIATARLASVPFFRDCETHITPALAPFIFVTSMFSHLVGASVGRESAAVQIGASIAEFFRRRLRLQEDLKIHFLHAGVAAGFGAAFLAPISAVLFAIEYKQKPSPTNILYSCVGSIIGFVIGEAMHTPHWQPSPELERQISNVSFSHIPDLGFWLAILLVAVVAVIYVSLETLIHRRLEKIPLWLLRLSTGVIFAAFTLWIGSPMFNNFGTPLLDASLVQASSLHDFGWKTIFTFVASTGHWNGGFFIPLMVVGGMLGSALAGLINSLFIAQAAAIGTFLFVHARFAVPLTCLGLTYEIYGLRIAILSLPAHAIVLIGQRYARRRLSSTEPPLSDE